MGMYTRPNGELNFSSPLNYREAKPLLEAIKAEEGGWDWFRLIEDRRETETEQGLLTVLSYPGIKPVGHSMKAIGYGWEDGLQKLIDLLPAGVQVEADSYIHGDYETGTQQRLYVRAGRVVKVEPVITWNVPDEGTER